MPTFKVPGPEVVFTYGTDLHIAALPPGKRRGGYREDILAKVQWWSDLTWKLGAVGLCGGDVFHVKNPRSNSNSFGVVNDTIHAMGSFPGGLIYGCVGNHDVTGDNLTTLPDQPLGVLMSAGVFRPVGADDHDPVIFETEDGLRVRVDSYDWMPGPELLALLQAQTSQVEGWEQNQQDHPWHRRIAIVHSFQQPGKSGAMFDDFALGHEDLKGTDYDVILYGHDHSRKGIARYDTGPTHVQLGSLSRAALSTDEVDRDVAIAVIRLSHTSVDISEMKVPVKPLTLAFHTADLVVEKVDKRSDVQAFFATLETQAKEVQSENPLEILATLTDDPAIIGTIKEVCEIG
jgi:DNA repair exonuclease SbcCD nuclease subunit